MLVLLLLLLLGFLPTHRLEARGCFRKPSARKRKAFVKRIYEIEYQGMGLTSKASRLTTGLSYPTCRFHGSPTWLPLADAQT
ncbi:MAG: hypothetical protein DMG05_00445 [Acidobacteria bacterium]|nr:MAG: hypothetical protein DMG05_00445 [Acidobacteriota bacterium]